MLHVAWEYIESECVKCAPVVAIDHFQNSHSRYNRPVLEHMTKTITLSLTDFFMVDTRISLWLTRADTNGFEIHVFTNYNDAICI